MHLENLTLKLTTILSFSLSMFAKPEIVMCFLTGSVDVRISSIALSVVSYTFSHHSLLILLKLGAFSSYNMTFCCFCCVIKVAATRFY